MCTTVHVPGMFSILVQLQTMKFRKKQLACGGEGRGGGGAEVTVLPRGFTTAFMSDIVIANTLYNQNSAIPNMASLQRTLSFNDGMHGV